MKVTKKKAKRKKKPARREEIYCALILFALKAGQTNKKCSEICPVNGKSESKSDWSTRRVNRKEKQSKAPKKREQKKRKK